MEFLEIIIERVNQFCGKGKAQGITKNNLPATIFFLSLDSHFESLNSHFESLDSDFESLDSHFESLDSDFESLDSDFESSNSRSQEKRFKTAQTKMPYVSVYA